MGRIASTDRSDKIVVQQLKGHHRSMVRDYVAGGLRNHELAKLYNMTEAQMSIIVNSPAFIAATAALEAEMEESAIAIRQRLFHVGPAATRVLARNVYQGLDEDAGMAERQLATKSSIDVLDRIAPKKEGLGSGNTFNITQTKVDVQNMTTENLRDDVFDILKEDEAD